MKTICIPEACAAIDREFLSRQRQEKNQAKKEINPVFLDLFCKEQVSLTNTVRKQYLEDKLDMLLPR